MPRPASCAAALAADREFHRLARQAYRHHRGPRHRLEVQLIKQLSIGPLPTLLNRLDRNGMQGSIEMREPFLDPAIVGFALNMTAEHRVTPRPKGILRELAEERFGPEIGGRPKQPFQFPVDAYIADAADPGFLGEGVLREVLAGSRRRWADRIAAAPPQERFLLWTGEIWARLTIEGQDVGRVENDLWRTAPESGSAQQGTVGELSSSG
jgi:asparagine synthase (glutamine-hydrolysing)